MAPVIRPRASQASRRSAAASSRGRPRATASMARESESAACLRAWLWRSLVTSGSSLGTTSPPSTSSTMRLLRASTPSPVRAETGRLSSPPARPSSSSARTAAGKSALLRQAMTEQPWLERLATAERTLLSSSPRGWEESMTRRRQSASAMIS